MRTRISYAGVGADASTLPQKHASTAGKTVYTADRSFGMQPFALLIGTIHMAKTAKKKAFKITPSKARRTRGDVVKQIAEATELKTGKVREVFDVLSQLIAADLGKGVGEFNFNGLMKLRTVKKPATPARKGRNPFTGEEIMIKAKPASRKVRVRALRTLNGMI
jgi:nucleoid DNA-binding protein